MANEEETKSNENIIDWRDDLKSISQMNKYMLDHQIRVDCTFRVGSDPDNIQVFHCHKLFLARSSSVFDTMFYGSLPEEKEIRVTDVEPRIFTLLLNYIYTYEVHLDDVNDSAELAMAATKYMLKSLRSKCLAYLCHNVDATNVLRCLDLSTLIDSQKLKAACEKVLQKDTRLLIHVDGLKNVSESTLMLLLDQNTLACEEFELVRAVEIWANEQIKIRNLNGFVGNVVRTCLEENVLPRLRFLTMKLEEFKLVSKFPWLTETERNFILSKIQNQNIIEEIPSKISTNTTSRYCNKTDCYENILISSCKNKEKFTLTRSFDYRRDIKARIHIKGRDEWFLGVQVHSQMKTPELVSEYGELVYKDNDLPEFYKEDIAINVYDCVCVDYRSQYYKSNILLGTKHSTSLTKYNSFTDIIFEKPIYLKSGSCSVYSIDITFKCDDGIYPVATCPARFDNTSDVYFESEDSKVMNSALVKALYSMKSSDMEIMYPHCYSHMHKINA